MKHKLQIASISKAKGEIYRILNFADDTIVRKPTAHELARWQTEIDRAIISRSRKVIDAGLDFSGVYFEMVERLLKFKEEK